MKIYNVYQSGKRLYIDEKENPDNKIVINKYDNEQQTLRLISDGTLPPRLYWALRNPRLSQKYFILPLINNEDLIVGTDISATPGLWDMLLIGTDDDYIIEGTDIDQSRLTYVSDNFGRLFVRDNFLEELDFEEQTSPTFRIFYDNLLDRIEELEKGGASESEIRKAVEEYLEENPIESNVTEVEKGQWNSYQTQIDSLQQNKADLSDVPLKTSQLENDSGHITNNTQGLLYYYKKKDTYNRDEINQLIGSIPKFNIEVVEFLPTENISTTTVYLLKSGEESENLYTEYIYVNGAWESLGKQSVDLTGYAKTSDIPSKISDLDNDSNFVTSDSVYSKQKIDTMFGTYVDDIAEFIDENLALLGGGEDE